MLNAYTELLKLQLRKEREREAGNPDFGVKYFRNDTTFAHPHFVLILKWNNSKILWERMYNTIWDLAFEFDQKCGEPNGRRQKQFSGGCLNIFKVIEGGKGQFCRQTHTHTV